MSVAVRCHSCQAHTEIDDSAPSSASVCLRCGGDLVALKAEDTVAFDASEHLDEPSDEPEEESLKGPGSGSVFEPIGMEIGGCLIESLIAKGGMGAVYLGQHLTLDIPVAVKIIFPGLHRDTEDTVRRFIQAAKIAARLKHPNIVGILNVGEEDGILFLVMEYVDGMSLEAMLADGVLSVDEALNVGIQIAEALSFAAGMNIVHRDIKPANILVAEDGAAKLADLGLARDMFVERSATQTGMVMGTVHYMSAEQAADARKVDIRSDIYSFGITLFEILTGRVPFDDNSLFRILDMHLRAEIPNPQLFNPEIPSGLSWIIRKCMAKRPAERYATAELLLADLRNAREGRPVEAEQEAIRSGWAEGDLSPAQRGYLRLRRMVIRIAWGKIFVLRTTFFAAASGLWYFMFFTMAQSTYHTKAARLADLHPESLRGWVDRLIARVQSVDSFFEVAWVWQEYMVLGILAYLLGNLLPVREEVEGFSLSRRICGCVLTYLGAILVGYEMVGLGIGISLGGVLLLFRAGGDEDDVATRMLRPSTRDRINRSPSRVKSSPGNVKS